MSEHVKLLPRYGNNQVNLKIGKYILFIISGKLMPQLRKIQTLLDYGGNYTERAPGWCTGFYLLVPENHS